MDDENRVDMYVLGSGDRERMSSEILLSFKLCNIIMPYVQMPSCGKMPEELFYKYLFFSTVHTMGIAAFNRLYYIVEPPLTLQNTLYWLLSFLPFFPFALHFL